MTARAGELRIARRDELPAAPRGELLQAGPLLVCDGATTFERTGDTEGFRAGAHQFDSDITDGRHPRAALGIGDRRLLAVACDGRAPNDAGLTLDELAEVLVALGARDALNLDGGGSATLIAGGRLRNRPRASIGTPEPGRPRHRDRPGHPAAPLDTTERPDRPGAPPPLLLAQQGPSVGLHSIELPQWMASSSEMLAAALLLVVDKG